MNYNFDIVIDRHNTNCEKWDLIAEKKMPADTLPLWVADMDFPVLPAITEALTKAVDHGIFGYPCIRGDYHEAVLSWFASHFDYHPSAESLVPCPTVVAALYTAVRAYTKEGDAVMIQTPVYGPFFTAIKHNNRKLVTNPLVPKENTYLIDFSDFEQKIVDNKVKLFVLCSPHNPVCRVWTKEELEQMGSICRKHGVLIVSDEIHADFVFAPHQHTVFATLSEDFAQHSIICTSPSKTFNLAGLQASNVFIANNELRQQFIDAMSRCAIPELSIMGKTACQSAYTHGAEWKDQLLDYLGANIQYTKDFLGEHLPQIKLIDSQGTYLLWLDVSAYGLSQTEMNNLLVEKGRLWLNSGTLFGEDGAGYQRVNIACPRATLAEALHRLAFALEGIDSK